MEGKRWCYWQDMDEHDKNGYIPSVVTEGEAGHSPLRGDPDKHQTPWYWGKTYEEAKRICAQQNERMGISEQDAADIVASSIGAQIRQKNAR